MWMDQSSTGQPNVRAAVPYDPELITRTTLFADGRNHNRL
jgi:hypothetical protein